MEGAGLAGGHLRALAALALGGALLLRYVLAGGQLWGNGVRGLENMLIVMAALLGAAGVLWVITKAMEAGGVVPGSRGDRIAEKLFWVAVVVIGVAFVLNGGGGGDPEFGYRR